MSFPLRACSQSMARGDTRIPTRNLSCSMQSSFSQETCRAVVRNRWSYSKESALADKLLLKDEARRLRGTGAHGRADDVIHPERTSGFRNGLAATAKLTSPRRHSP